MKSGVWNPRTSDPNPTFSTCPSVPALALLHVAEEEGGASQTSGGLLRAASPVTSSTRERFHAGPSGGDTLTSPPACDPFTHRLVPGSWNNRWPLACRRGKSLLSPAVGAAAGLGSRLGVKLGPSFLFRERHCSSHRGTSS